MPDILTVSVQALFLDLLLFPQSALHQAAEASLTLYE